MRRQGWTCWFGLRFSTSSDTSQKSYEANSSTLIEERQAAQRHTPLKLQKDPEKNIYMSYEYVYAYIYIYIMYII